MYTFTSVAALCGLLEQAYHAGPGETGRTKFVDVLKTTFEFGDGAAHLYAETALGSNSDNSASIVRTNAERLIGTWRATDASSLADLGYGGNTLSSRMEEWNFADDLTYTYRLEKQISLMSPYGSMVRPSSTSEGGVWVPPDRTGPQINILLLRDGTDGRKAVVDWLGSDDDRPMQCRINGTRLLRFWMCSLNALFMWRRTGSECTIKRLPSSAVRICNKNCSPFGINR